MSESFIKYGTNTDITITMTSLGIDLYRSSAVVDNSSTLFLDAMVGGSTRVGALTATGILDILAYASWDGGTNYSGGLDGLNAEVTWGTTPASSSILGFLQLMRIGVVNVDTTDDNNEIEWGPFSVAGAFGGNLPKKWGIVIKNGTDIALHATQGVAALKFDPITFTTV